jgi:cbb3-type cytochrome oxidase maturation protein
VTGVLILLVTALTVGGIFTALLVYAVREGQFDDLDDPPERMLRDD